MLECVRVCWDVLGCVGVGKVLGCVGVGKVLGCVGMGKVLGCVGVGKVLGCVGIISKQKVMLKMMMIMTCMVIKGRKKE